MLLVLLSVVPALGLLLATGLEERRMAVEEAQQSAFRIISPASFQFDRIIQETRQLLLLLVDHPVIQRHDPAACGDFMSRLLAKYPHYANLAMVEQDGRIVCSALPFQGSIDVAALPHVARAARTNDLAIGEYEIGPISKKAVIGFMYPLPASNGRQGTVLGATLNLTWLNRLAEQARLPRGSTLSVIDRRGMVLVRYPDPGPWIGRNLAGMTLVQTVLSRRTGVAMDRGLDGSERVYAFAPLGNDPQLPSAYMVVGIPRDVAFAKADAMLVRNLAAMGLIGVLAMAVAWTMGDWFILRRIKALVEATRHLASGNLSVRTELPHTSDEIGRLAASFDDMAEAIELLTQQHRLILNSAGEGIYGGDRNGTIRFINPTAARMLGYTVEDLLGRNGHALLHAARPDGSPYPEAECPIKRTIQDGQVRRVTDDVMWRKDGSPCPVEYVVSPIHQGGAIVGVVLTIQDVTEKRRAEQERIQLIQGEASVRAELDAAKQLATLKTNFVNAVSHDLRTPLTSIMGYSEFLVDGVAGELTPTQREYLTQIERASRRLEFLVNDLLDLARVDAGTFQLRCADADLGALIQETAISVQPLLVDRRQRLEIEGTEEPLIAPMDAQRIERVLGNYLSNAMRFTPLGGHIRISARWKDEATLLCEVSDDGPGIASEEIPKLFQRFSQLATGMHHAGGTGLGLSISKTIIEAHGGAVGVRSEEGAGSTFWFTLPLHGENDAT